MKYSFHVAAQKACHIEPEGPFETGAILILSSLVYSMRRAIHKGLSAVWRLRL